MTNGVSLQVWFILEFYRIHTGLAVTQNAMYAGGDPQGEHQPGGHEDGSFNVAEEHANGQQRHAQEEAPLHPTNLGSQGG